MCAGGRGRAGAGKTGLSGDGKGGGVKVGRGGGGSGGDRFNGDTACVSGVSLPAWEYIIHGILGCISKPKKLHKGVLTGS